MALSSRTGPMPGPRPSPDRKRLRYLRRQRLCRRPRKAILKKWTELDPDPALIVALEEADKNGSRALALRARSAPVKTQWSNRFADACAHMVAAELRWHKDLKGLTVLPENGRSIEPPTFTAAGKKKKVDVLASSLVSGLQIGISLKGMNFRDRRNLNFDKNLTGRTYELQDEIRVIHGYQPSAFLVAMYFLPIAATEDKKGPRSVSSFARTVQHLRARTGRTDPMAASQLDRCDMAVVALYVPGDQEAFTYASQGRRLKHSYRDALSQGVIRYFDVMSDPPRRGRPPLETTLNLSDLVEVIVGKWSGESHPINWTEPEAD